MSNQKGITLVSLVMTIILIIIIAGIGTYTGVESYNNMKVQTFVAKMITIQEAVNKLCEKHTIDEINAMGENSTAAPTDATLVLTEVIADASNLKSWYGTTDNVSTNYRYFSIENINTILGIKDFDTAIWINPSTRNVIAVEGVKFEDKMYYRQYDLSNGQALPEPNLNVNFALTYDIYTYDNKAEIVLNKDNEVTVFSEVKYYKKKADGSNSEAKVLSNVSKITLEETGVYKIEAIDSAGNMQSQDNVSITIVNKPLLVDGMNPVKFNEDGTMTVISDEEDLKSWYNYDESVRNWANATLKDGSVYVWIPRYAYEINSTTTPKTIDIKFLREFSKMGTDGLVIPSSYKVAPAFQDGKTTSFANGEWDEEITGIWVAKYETTNNSNKPKNALVAAVSWRSITPVDAFNLCRQMESKYITTYFGTSVVAADEATYNYGEYTTDTNNIDTHLMKNSEWGAVAYLTYSKYGVQGEKCEDYYIKNSANEGNSAPKYSTTNNYTGIYGFNGGAHDMVSAGVNIAGYLNSENKSTKYATYYSTGTITDEANKIYGDAMKETSGWDSNGASNPTQLICRGGVYTSTSGTGIFAYQNKNYDASDTVTFRPVLIVEY